MCSVQSWTHAVTHFLNDTIYDTSIPLFIPSLTPHIFIEHQGCAVALLGTKDAGKSTVSALMELTSQWGRRTMRNKTSNTLRKAYNEKELLVMSNNRSSCDNSQNDGNKAVPRVRPREDDATPSGVIYYLHSLRKGPELDFEHPRAEFLLI